MTTDNAEEAESRSNEERESDTEDRVEHSFEELFSLVNLRSTWRVLRRELRQADTRDVIDWTDWALTIETSLTVIQCDVLSGDYVPARATRIESGKSRGSYRILSALNVRDALIYRHICDRALSIALPRKVPGAYFSRRFTPTPIGRTFDPQPNPSDRFYAIWLRYNQYRSRTLLNEPYEILVITDISNYFDSIQHDLLFEYLAPLGLPRKAVGLLGRLIEAFRPESGHSPSPRVGIPVDELDCSRELAHIFLFEHDRRITEEFGEENYVRWMDDQNLGVRNMAEGRRVINAMTRSLAEQRLTLNTGKTVFLRPEEVAVHFQLSANEELENWWSGLKDQRWQMNDDLRTQLRDLWQTVCTGQEAEKGNWDKIMKRFYAYAARANLDMLENRALDDMIRFPHVCERIFQYYARRNRGNELIDLFMNYAESGENLFENVEYKLLESLLLLDANEQLAERCLALAREMASGSFPHQTGKALGRAAAILCLYWHGASVDVIETLYSENEAPSLPKEVARAWIACAAALRSESIHGPIGNLFGHSSDDVLRLVRFLQALLNGQVSSLGNYKNQKQRWPLPGKYYDARAWLLLELASQGRNQNLLNTTRSHLQSFLRLIYTEQERAISVRVASRLGVELQT